MRTFGTKSIVYSAPAVHLGVAALAPEALHVGHGETVHTEVLERVLHVVELERLDDAHDELHGGQSLRLRTGRASHPIECVSGLGMLREVETGLFVLLGRTRRPAGAAA